MCILSLTNHHSQAVSVDEGEEVDVNLSISLKAIPGLLKKIALWLVCERWVWTAQSG